VVPPSFTLPPVQSSIASVVEEWPEDIGAALILLMAQFEVLEIAFHDGACPAFLF